MSAISESVCCAADLFPAYTRLPIPADAPVELRPSPGKGYGAFATRDIKKNEVILRGEALFVIKKPVAKITEAQVRRAVRKLTPQKKSQFMSIRDNGSKRFPTLLDSFCEDSVHVIQPDGTEGHGPSVLLSRFNHSCVPNARVPFTGDGNGSIVANRDIATGEEVTNCYIPVFLSWTSSERRKHMRFVCDCRTCVPGTDYQLLSDTRRRLIRGLYFLVTGLDNGPEESGPDCPIPDPKLRKAAYKFTTPLTSRFAQGLLYFALLEAEGLLHDDLVDLVTDITDMAGTWLKTENNARVADLVGKQENRFAKFGVASTIYGQPDEGDRMSPTILPLFFGPIRRVPVPRVGTI